LNTPNKKTGGKEAFFHPLDDVGGGERAVFVTLWILVLPSSRKFSRMGCRGRRGDVSRTVGIDVDGEVVEVVAFVKVAVEGGVVVGVGMPV